MAVKKLIEVALPLEKINEESAREKSIRHGHPSTLHLWWARRPLAAARAVIWSSLVDDPSSHPEEFPTEDEQNKERERLFRILEDLVVWENSNNKTVLDAAKAEIMKSTGGNPPPLLDPFAGGGAIPLEAQRLGLEAHAHDLNPVAVMINKAMIEIPPRFADMPPVNPRDSAQQNVGAWPGTKGLAADVRYYGEWMRDEAFRRIGHLYPKVKVPDDLGGGEATVFTWIWARTAKCSNPACNCEIPLVGSYELSIKKGNEAWAKPIVDSKTIFFEIQHGKCPEEYKSFKMGRSALFKCPACGDVTTDAYIKSQGKKGNIHAQLMAVVAEGERGRLYISPDKKQSEIARVTKPEDAPVGEIPNNPRWFSPPAFGIKQYSDLFSNRQLLMLTTFENIISDLPNIVEEDALKNGITNKDDLKEYGQAICVYLAFVIDKMLDYHSTLTSWHMTRESIANALRRQALPMVWDYTEVNPFCNSAGSFNNMLNRVVDNISNFSLGKVGIVNQAIAQEDCSIRNVMISTDPPYYDNIGYADLSDYFYIWLRQSLKKSYPNLFTTMLVPKSEELVATPYHFDGNAKKAKEFFENGMSDTCKQLYKYSNDIYPVTIYYAYKQSGTADTDSGKKASSGWETMLTSIIESGFSITGTWPMRTELITALKGSINALASSIVLVCRKRPENASSVTRRNFINELKRELKPALQKLQSSNIAPVDLAQSAIGPGMAVFSKYKSVLEADGTEMTIRTALQIINQELDLYFNEQDTALDKESRFCVDLYTQFAFNDVKFGDADTLARAKNTSVDALKNAGVVFAEKGVVRLLGRDEINETKNENILWLLTQQMTREFENGGIQKCAEFIRTASDSACEQAKALAYRLFTIADRKGWNAEAYAYNNLVTSWAAIKEAATRLGGSVQQITFDD